MKTIKSLVTAACFATSSALAFAANAAEPESSVWKVTKGDDHIFVGGTVHILPVSEFPLPAQFTTAYSQSDAVVFEAKLPDPTNMKAQQAMMQAMSFEAGKSLKDVLSEQTYQALGQYFASLGGNIDQLAGLKPGLIMTMILATEAQRARMAGEGVDSYFMQLADKDAKPAEFLESMDFQIQLLANMGQGEEDNFMKQTLADIPNFKTNLEKLISAWRKGDEVTLNKLVIEKTKEQSPAMFQSVFVERNQNWVPKIEQMFGDEDTEFVLVGVGHLIGEKNVLSLLEAKGYQVTRL